MVTMVTVLIMGLVMFGLVLGSFAGAQVWRLRAYQLRDDDKRLATLKKQKQLSDLEKQEKAELTADSKDRKLERRRLDGLLVGVKQDYSQCLHCRHRLYWYDLLPLVSWLSTLGKCRYCRQPIGYFEPIIELGMAAFFVLSYLLWPVELAGTLEISQFVVWLLAGVALGIMFAYDAKWFLLPDVIMIPFTLLAALYAGLELYQAGVNIESVISLGGAVAVLSGLYGLLYAVSRGTWVGFGDVKLGIGLALLLGRFDLAIVALFLANLLGTLFVLPQLLGGKLGRKSPIPFGPLLILGMVMTHFWGAKIIDWYINLL